jgi:hypothetical protein
VDIEAPDLMELAQLCDFAETRLNQLVGEDPCYDSSEVDPPSEWERGCLTRTKAWLQQLKKIGPRERVRLAAQELDAVNYGVETIWVISTAHITQETAERLASAGYTGLTSFPTGESGWMIWVGSTDADGEIEAGLPAELDALFRHCTILGIGWLCLDRDAVQHPDFQTFDW